MTEREKIWSRRNISTYKAKTRPRRPQVSLCQITKIPGGPDKEEAVALAEMTH